MTVGRFRSLARAQKRRRLLAVAAFVTLAALASGCEIVAGIQDIELTGSTFEGGSTGIGPRDGSYGVIGDATAPEASGSSAEDASANDGAPVDSAIAESAADDGAVDDGALVDGAVDDGAIVDGDSTSQVDGGGGLDASPPTDGGDDGGAARDASDAGASVDPADAASRVGADG